jgi:uncharacterized DUF497 family protein
MRVEWDASKDEANREKHRLGFKEAAELFLAGVNYLELFDEGHSDEEDRFIAVGRISRGVVVVVFTEPDEDVVRIVSAGTASKGERLRFERHEKGV